MKLSFQDHPSLTIYLFGLLFVVSFLAALALVGFEALITQAHNLQQKLKERIGDYRLPW